MRRKPDYGRESAMLLATAAVFSLGFLGVVFAITSSFSDPLWPTIITAVAFLALFAFAILSLRAREDIRDQGGLRAWFKARKPAEPPPHYSPRRVRTSSQSSTSSNNPPSADDVRDLKETSANAWVPSSVPRETRPR